MADSKLVDMTAEAAPAATDLLYMVKDPAGTPLDRKVALGDAVPLLGAWTTYTPAWTAVTTNPAIGNGTILGAWKQVGKLLVVRISIVMGSTTTYGSGKWILGLPAGKTTKNTAGLHQVLAGSSLDTSAGNFVPSNAILQPNAGTTYRIGAGTGATLDSANPFTWANTDVLALEGILELD